MAAYENKVSHMGFKQENSKTFEFTFQVIDAENQIKSISWPFWVLISKFALKEFSSNNKCLTLSNSVVATKIIKN